jgi:hypothetical protein
MGKYTLALCLTILLAGFNAQAEISPVVIATHFNIGDWQPLPEDKIKSAAVDSALSEISKTRRFAFFTSPQPALKTGKLSIHIKLIEDAQIATVSILLQPAKGASISSTHSESLKNLYFDGIYQRFQKAGSMAGKKLVNTLLSNTAANSKTSITSDDQARVDYLENQIISINNKIIQQTDNNPVRQEAKLEFILNELTAINRGYAKLAKQEDLHKQGIKIDRVLNKMHQLDKKITNRPSTQVNINQSYVIENPLLGHARIAHTSTPGRDDIKARQLYTAAQQAKQYKKFTQAEKNLSLALKMLISPGLSALILDELNYALPMFEAQTIAIELGVNFQGYASKKQHTHMFNRITYLYKFALTNNQNDFQRTRQIQQRLDQHINTTHAMTAVLDMQNKNNGHMIHRYMQRTYMMQGEYPDKDGFKQLLKRYGLRFKVVSYRLAESGYSAELQSDSGIDFSLRVDEHGQLTVN